MKLKNAFLIFLIFLLGCNNTPEKTTNHIIIDYFEDYQNYGVSVAIDNLFATNKYFEVSDSAVYALKLKLKSLLPDLGQYYGNELLTVKCLGEDYCLYSVLAKYQRQPLRYTFIVYSINGVSHIQNFRFDLDYDKELEEASEAYFLKNNY